MSAGTLFLSLALILGADPPASEESRAADSARRVLELAKQYEFFAEPECQTKLELSKPLLVYSNPVRGDVHGNVFVWTLAGRPEVIGAFFDFRSEDKLDSELHLLSRAGTVSRREGKVFWSPEQAGTTFQPLADSPPPATTAEGRLRQMRDLARQFSVERDHPEQGKGAVRLLTQPIYRYSSEAAKVLDGAIFAFVEGTDPEAYLLLEATAGEKSAWRFAFARMNIVAFDGLRDGKSVWHVEPVSWDSVFDKHEPYAIIREHPRRGLIRTR